MKPYTLIIIPRWLYDKHRPVIERTANWKTYLRIGREFMVCCLKSRRVYDTDSLYGVTCGDRDDVIQIRETDDFERTLRYDYYLVPDREGVTPE